MKVRLISNSIIPDLEVKNTIRFDHLTVTVREFRDELFSRSSSRVKFVKPSTGKVALKASDEARPIDDIRSSAEYRREMIIALTRRALKQSLEQLE